MIYLPGNLLASRIEIEIWQCEGATPGFRFFSDSARIANRQRENARSAADSTRKRTKTTEAQ